MHLWAISCIMFSYKQFWTFRHPVLELSKRFLENESIKWWEVVRQDWIILLSSKGYICGLRHVWSCYEYTETHTLHLFLPPINFNSGTCGNKDKSISNQQSLQITNFLLRNCKRVYWKEESMLPFRARKLPLSFPSLCVEPIRNFRSIPQYW